MLFNLLLVKQCELYHNFTTTSSYYTCQYLYMYNISSVELEMEPRPYSPQTLLLGIFLVLFLHTVQRICSLQLKLREKEVSVLLVI